MELLYLLLVVVYGSCISVNVKRVSAGIAQIELVSGEESIKTGPETACFENAGMVSCTEIKNWKQRSDLLLNVSNIEDRVRVWLESNRMDMTWFDPFKTINEPAASRGLASIKILAPEQHRLYLSQPFAAEHPRFELIMKVEGFDLKKNNIKLLLDGHTEYFSKANATLQASVGSHGVSVELVDNAGRVYASDSVFFEVLNPARLHQSPTLSLPPALHPMPVLRKLGHKVRVGFINHAEIIDGISMHWQTLIRAMPQDVFEIVWMDLTQLEPNPDTFARFASVGVELFSFMPTISQEICATADLCIALLLELFTSISDLSELDPYWRKIYSPLIDLLLRLDVVMLVNSLIERDNFLLDLARLCGVKVRILDLGVGAKIVGNPPVTALISPSHYIREHPLVKARNVPTYVVSPSVNTTRFDPERVRFLPDSPSFAWMAQSRFPIVLFVGRAATEKSPALFVRVAAVVQQQRPGTRFVMVGSGGSEKKDMSQVVTALAGELSAQIDFIPWIGQEDLPLVMRHCACLLVPSSGETFHLASVEALAMEVPVVSFGTGGLSEHTVDGVTGLTANKMSHVELAKSVIRLIDDPVFARSLGVNGRQYVLDHFATKDAGARTAALLLELMEDALRESK